MNALANSQLEELDKFLHGYAADKRPFTVARYTGQEEDLSAMPWRITRRTFC